MPKIPGPESLGRVKPQSGQVVSMQLGREAKAKAQAAQSDPMGGVITQLGSQALDMAAKQREREDRIAVVTKKSEFTQKMIGFESGLDGDTDYKTYGKRFHDEMQKAKREAIGGVENDFMRKTLEADLNLDISQGLSRMGKRSWGAEKEHGLKEMNDILVRNRELSLNTDDPKLRESLLNDMKRAIAISVDNDYLDEDQGGELNRQVAIGTAEAIISMRPAQEQIAMLKSGDGIAEAIPSDRRKQLLDKVDTRGISQEKADDIWLSGKDDAAMLKDAEKIKDPKIRDDTKTRIKNRINERESLTRQKEEEAYKDAMRIAVDTTDIDAIPSETLAAMNGVDYARVNDYISAKLAKQANGRKTDEYDILDDVEQKIESGDINETSQLAEYEPFLRDATIRTLRKGIQKRDYVKPSEMKRAFELRSPKKLTASEPMRKQFVAFQEFVLDKVRDTGRPEDVDHLADKWFMEGYGAEDKWNVDDPNVFGESLMKGRSDFIIKVPEIEKENVDATISLLRQQGVEIPKDGADKFYTNTYSDGARYLEAHEYPITPTSMVAYARLKAAGKTVTIDNIQLVEESMRE